MDIAGFTIIASPRAAHQVQHQRALAAGLEANGIQSALVSHDRPKSKRVACWGWRLGKMLRERGHDVLVMERGYLGDRFNWSSLAWNGLNGRGQFAAAPSDGGERFNLHFQMKPWKTGGEYIVVMGQVPGDASLQGKNMLPWYRSVAAEAQVKYGLPIFFRPHPVALRKGIAQAPKEVNISCGDLVECLTGAAMVITFNSNSAVDSVLAGVPTVAVDSGSMAYAVCANKIGEIKTPDRNAWAHQLAWRQWSLEEIASGFAVNKLLGALNG